MTLKLFVYFVLALGFADVWGQVVTDASGNPVGEDAVNQSIVGYVFPCYKLYVPRLKRGGTMRYQSSSGLSGSSKYRLEMCLEGFVNAKVVMLEEQKLSTVSAKDYYATTIQNLKAVAQVGKVSEVPFDDNSVGFLVEEAIIGGTRVKLLCRLMRFDDGFVTIMAVARVSDWNVVSDGLVSCVQGCRCASQSEIVKAGSEFFVGVLPDGEIVGKRNPSMTSKAMPINVPNQQSPLREKFRIKSLFGFEIGEAYTNQSRLRRKKDGCWTRGFQMKLKKPFSVWGTAAMSYSANDCMLFRIEMRSQVFKNVDRGKIDTRLAEIAKAIEARFAPDLKMVKKQDGYEAKYPIDVHQELSIRVEKMESSPSDVRFVFLFVDHAIFEHESGARY